MVVASYYRPYMQALSIDNGYRFFAPNPGPGNTIRYELTMPDGTVDSGRFPDRERHRPRLLYHRYFMLSERIHGEVGPVVAPPQEGFKDPQQQQQFDAQRKRAEMLVAPVARQLLRESGAKRVKMFLVTRDVPSMADVRNGMSLTDERLIVETPIGEFDESTP